MRSTSAIDPEMAKEVLDRMIGLVEGGMALACVADEKGFARAATDRMLFSNVGEIVEDAPQ